MNLPSAPEFPEIIAHRGASHDAPENSGAAFRLAWEQQSDALEIDIRLSHDGHAVVMHDASTLRTGGLDMPVSAQTLAALKSLDIGTWKDLRWILERIPTLAEALATVPKGKKIFVEIKCGPEILPALERDLAAARLAPEQVVLIGFSRETLQKAKTRLPHHAAYWLVPFKEDPQTGKIPEVDSLVEKALAAGFDGLNMDFRFLADASTIARVKAAGLKYYCWTVDDPRTADKLRQAGVDGITTNQPADLRSALR